MPNDAPELLTKRLVLKRYLPIGARTFERMLATGRFPAADVKLGAKLHFWRRQTVEDAISAWAEGRTMN